MREQNFVRHAQKYFQEIVSLKAHLQTSARLRRVNLKTYI
jgi:hypothetical protein